MNTLSVPQRTVSVAVELQQGRSLSGITYMPAIGPDQEPYRLVDRLESPAEFIALTGDTGTHLVQVAKILTVLVAGDEVEDQAIERLMRSQRSRCLQVKIDMGSGPDVCGEVAYFQPQDQDRLQDYLNTGRRFVTVRVEEGQIYVNRRQILTVIELAQESPAPVPRRRQPEASKLQAQDSSDRRPPAALDRLAIEQ